MRSVHEEPVRDVVVSEKVDDGGARTMAGRVIGSIAAAVPIVMGIVAAVRLDWGQGFAAAPVDVAGVAIGPEVALLAIGTGILALAAAAIGDRAGDVLMGAVVACAGIALLAARPAASNGWALSQDLGWVAVLVGAALIVAGLVTAHGWRYRRSVRRMA